MQHGFGVKRFGSQERVARTQMSEVLSTRRDSCAYPVFDKECGGEVRKQVTFSHYFGIPFKVRSVD